MARSLTEDEIQVLLPMGPKAAAKWIGQNFGILDAAEASKTLSNARSAANPPATASGLEHALGLGGIGAGAAGIATARLLELTKGTTTTYEAPLNVDVVADRLRTALSDFSTRVSGEQIVVVRNDDAEEFCRVRVSVSGDQTTVVTSGLKLLDKKQGGGLLDDLVGVGKDVLAGQGLGSVLDFVSNTALAAAEVGSDLWVANTLASTIETYGAELERKANTVRSAAQVKAARIQTIYTKLGTCESCGQSLPKDGSGMCVHCSATTDVAGLQAELSRLLKS